MTEKTQPTDAELDAVLYKHWPAFSMQATLVRMWVRAAMRAAIVKWGTPPSRASRPKAAPGEQLTREQIREVFMAHGFTIKEGQTDLKQYVYDAAYALLELVAAPQQEPCQTCTAMARTVMMDQVSFDRKPDCYGIRQITDDDGIEEWEDIRTSPDVAREEANDMMATGRGEIYEVVPLWTTPQPAPAPLSDDVVKDAARWRMVALIGNEVMLHPEKRTQAAAVKAYMDATHSGLDLTGAVDAAIAAQKGTP